MDKIFLKCKHFYLAAALLLMVTGLTGSNGENRSTTASSGNVVFSEVLYDSSVSYDTQGEWIELYNPQSTTVNIGGWTIQDNTTTFTIPGGTTIGPQTYLIIADGITYFSNLYGCVPGVSCDTLKLSNTGDYLILRNSSGTIIDQVAWESGGSSIPGWGSSSQPYANEGKTIRRSNLNTDTDTHSDWISNSSPQPDCGSSGGGDDGGEEPGEEPFGIFATPIDGSIVSSSIPVTGWALDDVGVESLKIYRKNNGNSIYIGDAVFVEGARPDIQIAYPGYPNNHKAGWGYMLLTNFLPNGGNGTFVLEAKAKDASGNDVTLGSKTIYCDNANAVKPFGAIDTPFQGGTASGHLYDNWGWVLTPLPNSIPSDGSTINVYVNGVYKGHPAYNIYRNDIASLFPGYANSDGAVGYFQLDTTGYTNGVHTIYWTAEDSAGNTDGIGSRYFIIQNAAGNKSSTQETYPLTEFTAIEICSLEPVQIRRGYNHESGLEWLSHDENGVLSVYIEELERLEIRLGNPFSGSHGYMKQGDQLKPLPVGSTFDRGNAVFYWQPGPGFVGVYELVFIENHPQQRMKKNIKITILPQHHAAQRAYSLL